MSEQFAVSSATETSPEPAGRRAVPFIARYVPILAVLVCVCAAAAGLALAGVFQRLEVPGDYSMLATTFRAWDTEPVSRHWFLAFATPADVESGQAYHHAGYAWLFLVYACLKPLNMLGVDYDTGQHLVMFTTFAAILALVWAMFDPVRPITHKRDATTATLSALVVMALTVIATIPALWIGSIIGDQVGQNWFLGPIVFAYFSAVDFWSARVDRVGRVAALALTILAPMYGPFLIVTLWVLGAGRDGRHTAGAGLTWPHASRQASVLAAVAVIGIVAPYVTIYLSGLRGVGSPLFYRSGLDGSTEYFTSMVQAIFQPYLAPRSRLWSLVPIPAAAVWIAATTACWSRPLAVRMLRQLLVAAACGLFMIAVFPQVVSIHPYVFDFGLIFPPAFCIAFWLIQPEVRDIVTTHRGVALALWIVLTALVMTNAIDLARFRHGGPNAGVFALEPRADVSYGQRTTHKPAAVNHSSSSSGEYLN